MKESLAYQILTSMMASNDDWLAQSPIPASSQQLQQLDVEELEGGLVDTDERLPVFYNPNELDPGSLLDFDLTELAPVVMQEVTSQLEAPCASTSALDVGVALEPQSVVSPELSLDVDSCCHSAVSPDLDASLDVEDSCNSDVFQRSCSSRSSCSGGDVREELKQRIRSKRMASGQGVLAVEFTPPEPEQLTEEEEQLRVERREKNRLAAQKCRNKKRERAELLEEDIAKLTKRRHQLQSVVEQLRDEKEKLEQIIDVHGSVCPKMRRLSKS